MKTLRRHFNSTRKPHTVINSYVHDRMFFIITRRAWRTDIASIFETLSHATSVTWKALLLVLQLTSEKKCCSRCPVSKVVTCYAKHRMRKKEPSRSSNLKCFAWIRLAIHHIANPWYLNKFSILVHANTRSLEYVYIVTRITKNLQFL